ncbi:HAD family hydrolase [Gordonia sp. SL306]|uniref:HAD family hydrolase n=1 Tax=Gordonia sp. SL306 TaxID=2995145 RepID=UPI00226D8114|nr:HAD family phosphatase [Gordonia sp. SL306]WAC55563.1 HAD family phosphatase [Gordonia sp. SL306]
MSAVVFDCDGLLLDTETCWSRAEASLFADYGYGFGPAEKDLLIGRTLEAACANMADLGRPGTGPELQGPVATGRARTRCRSRTYARCRRAFETSGRPGAALGVATNSQRGMLDAALAAASIANFFAVSVAADEVAHPKPNPELYLRAFEQLSASPRTCVALEDSSTGVAAARNAGAYLITAPSQQGKKLEGDLVASALDDPRIVEWALTVDTM